MNKKSWTCSFIRMIVAGDLATLDANPDAQFEIPVRYTRIVIFQRGLALGNEAMTRALILNVLRLDGYLNNGVQVSWSSSPFYDRGGYVTTTNSPVRIDIKFVIDEQSWQNQIKQNNGSIPVR